MEPNSTSSAALKICVVCGKHAHGMYFGALVCLPCKSFFIRSTKDGPPQFQCQGQHACAGTDGSRVGCQACRYSKCLAVGMCRKVKPQCIEPLDGQELCTVCGDIANGLHFGVMTCEGCKKFFRRGLKEWNTYACRSDQKCVINPSNRNQCRYCRYQKCIAVGMSRDAIKMGRPRKAMNSTNPDECELGRSFTLPHQEKPPNTKPLSQETPSNITVAPSTGHADLHLSYRSEWQVFDANTGSGSGDQSIAPKGDTATTSDYIGPQLVSGKPSVISAREQGIRGTSQPQREPLKKRHHLQQPYDQIKTPMEHGFSETSLQVLYTEVEADDSEDDMPHFPFRDVPSGRREKQDDSQPSVQSSKAEAMSKGTSVAAIPSRATVQGEQVQMIGSLSSTFMKSKGIPAHPSSASTTPSTPISCPLLPVPARTMTSLGNVHTSAHEPRLSTVATDTVREAEEVANSLVQGTRPRLLATARRGWNTQQQNEREYQDAKSVSGGHRKNPTFVTGPSAILGTVEPMMEQRSTDDVTPSPAHTTGSPLDRYGRSHTFIHKNKDTPDLPQADIGGAHTGYPAYMHPITTTAVRQGNMRPVVATSTLHHGNVHPIVASTIHHGNVHPIAASTIHHGNMHPISTSSFHHGNMHPSITSPIHFGNKPPIPTSIVHHGNMHPIVTSSGYHGNACPITTSAGYHRNMPPITISTACHGNMPPIATSAVNRGNMRPIATSAIQHGNTPHTAVSGVHDGAPITSNMPSDRDTNSGSFMRNLIAKGNPPQSTSACTSSSTSVPPTGGKGNSSPATPRRKLVEKIYRVVEYSDGEIHVEESQVTLQNAVDNPRENVVENMQGSVAGNVAENPQGDVVKNLRGKVAENPRGNMVEYSSGNMVENPRGNVVENLHGKVAENPRGNMVEYPPGNRVENPRGNVVENLRGKVSENPRGNVVEKVTEATLPKQDSDQFYSLVARQQQRDLPIDLSLVHPQPAQTDRRHVPEPLGLERATRDNDKVQQQVSKASALPKEHGSDVGNMRYNTNASHKSTHPTSVSTSHQYSATHRHPQSTGPVDLHIHGNTGPNTSTYDLHSSTSCEHIEPMDLHIYDKTRPNTGEIYDNTSKVPNRITELAAHHSHAQSSQRTDMHSNISSSHTHTSGLAGNENPQGIGQEGNTRSMQNVSTRGRAGAEEAKGSEANIAYFPIAHWLMRSTHPIFPMFTLPFINKESKAVTDVGAENRGSVLERMLREGKEQNLETSQEPKKQDGNPSTSASACEIELVDSTDEEEEDEEEMDCETDGQKEHLGPKTDRGGGHCNVQGENCAPAPPAAAPAAAAAGGSELMKSWKDYAGWGELINISHPPPNYNTTGDTRYPAHESEEKAAEGSGYFQPYLDVDNIKQVNEKYIGSKERHRSPESFDLLDFESPEDIPTELEMSSSDGDVMRLSSTMSPAQKCSVYQELQANRAANSESTAPDCRKRKSHTSCTSEDGCGHENDTPISGIQKKLGLIMGDDFDMGYWLNPSIPEISCGPSAQQQYLLKFCTSNYFEMLDVMDEGSLSEEEQAPNKQQQWPVQGNEYNMWLHVQKRIARNTAAQTKFIMDSCQGLKMMPKNDLSTLMSNMFLVALLPAAHKFYMPEKKCYRYFYNWTIPVDNPIFPFKVKLLEFAEKFHFLHLDDTEGAMLTCLGIVASDWHVLEDKVFIEEQRLPLIQAFAAYLFEKYEPENGRMEDLFSFIPTMRGISSWHRAIMKNMKAGNKVSKTFSKMSLSSGSVSTS